MENMAKRLTTLAKVKKKVVQFINNYIQFFFSCIVKCMHKALWGF